jgi:hypothetical protein
MNSQFISTGSSKEKSPPFRFTDSPKNQKYQNQDRHSRVRPAADRKQQGPLAPRVAADVRHSGSA